MLIRFLGKPIKTSLLQEQLVHTPGSLRKRMRSKAHACTAIEFKKLVEVSDINKGTPMAYAAIQYIR